MLTRRLIVSLDVCGGRVVKGVRFADLTDVGDPAALAERYEAEGVDEVVYLDISASAEERAPLFDLARRTAERLFVPLTIGGGIASAAEVARALRAGADRVSINTAAVERPEVLTEVAERFGSQCVVASIDVRRDYDVPGHGGAHDPFWRVYIRGGQVHTGFEAVGWARECVRRGAGEILLTSIDRDGSRRGYDLALTRAVSDAVNVPVIGSGGAGSAEHVCDVFREGRASAALLAGIVHDGLTTVRAIKDRLAQEGMLVRA